MILLINASPRKHGTTATILHYISHQLNTQNITTKLVHVADLNLQYCVGCFQCYQTGNCIYNDDIEALSYQILKSDGVVIGSPTYASNISGQLKTIIDRGHFIMEQLLYNKYSMSVITYENYGGKTASIILKRLLCYSGSYVAASLAIKNTCSRNPLDDPHIKNCILKKTQKFSQHIVKKRRFPFQSLKHFLIFNFGIVPFVRKKGSSYSGIVNAWNKKREV